MEGPRASTLEQGSSVGPGDGGGSVLSLQRKSAEAGPRAQAGRLHSHGDWQWVGQSGSFPVHPLKAWPIQLWAPALGRCGSKCHWAGQARWAGSALGSRVPGAQSRASSKRHLRAWSLCASGRIWLRIPPSRLDVASVARMRGFTTVGGSWRITPPTAPVSPFCSWPRDATSQMV